MIFTFVLINFMLLLNASYTNLFNRYHPHEVLADLGGVLCGFPLGLVMMPRARNGADHVGSYERFMAKIGAGILVVYWAILFSCYFTVYNPLSFFTEGGFGN